MAHLPALCELARRPVGRFRRVMTHVQYDWRSAIRAPCALCAQTAKGGSLCLRCYDLVTGSMRDAAQRCACCCLALDEQGACADCAANTPAFDRIVAAFDYCAPADILIHRLKVSRRFTDVPMLGHLLVQEVVRVWPDLPADLTLVPVPSSGQAIRRRGFNPAAEVASVLARRLNRRYKPDIVRRVRDGHKQATLNREERLISMNGVYQLAADVQGARIAVVDDVLTTGSTIHTIAQMLKRSGATSVYGLVLARTPRFF